MNDLLAKWCTGTTESKTSNILKSLSKAVIKWNSNNYLTSDSLTKKLHFNKYNIIENSP